MSRWWEVGGSGGGFVVQVGPESTYLMLPGVVWSMGGVGFWGRATQGYGCRPGTGRQALRAIPVGTNVVRSRLYDFHRLHITIKAADDYYMLLCTYVLCFCWFGGDRLSYIPYIRFIGVMLCQFRLREGREVFNTLFLAGRRQALPRGAVIT